MKHIIQIIFLIVPFIFLGQENKSDFVSFEDKLNSLSVDYSNIDKSISIFLEESKNITKQESDSLFSMLFRSVVKIENELNEKLHIDYTQDYEKNLNKHNLRVASAEGVIYLVYDFNTWKNDIKSVLTTTSGNIFELLILERDYPTSEDAGLKISLNELADRIIQLENSLNQNFTPLEDLAKDTYDYYFGILIHGIDNAPIRESYSSKNINKDYLNSYKYMISKYPNNNSTKIVKEYYGLMERNNFQLSVEIEKFNEKK